MRLLYRRGDGDDMLLWVLLTACTATKDTDTADTDGGVDTDTDVVTVEGTAKMWFDCAPDDGAAFDVVPDEPDDACHPDQPSSSHPMFVQIWAAAAPGTWTLPSEGFASRCVGADCVTATSGTVTIDSYVEGTGGTGSFDLVFDDGTHAVGTFDAAWCEHTPLCG